MQDIDIEKGHLFHFVSQRYELNLPESRQF